MSETGFRCPKCGNGSEFVASGVWVLFSGVRITPEGWDWNGGKALASDMHTECSLRCRECGFEGDAGEFDDEGC